MLLIAITWKGDKKICNCNPDFLKTWGGKKSIPTSSQKPSDPICPLKLAFNYQIPKSMAYPYSYFGSLQHLTGSLPALQRRNLETAFKMVLGNGFETVRLTAQQTKLFFSTDRREHKALISQPLPQHPAGEQCRAHYVPPTKEGDRLGSQLDCWRLYPSANILNTASSHLARTEITNRSNFS